MPCAVGTYECDSVEEVWDGVGGTMHIRWYGKDCRKLVIYGLHGRWIEYRPKLRVFDAFCINEGYSMAAMMAGARKLRTNDLFEAIGFIVRNGYPSKEQCFDWEVRDRG